MERQEEFAREIAYALREEYSGNVAQAFDSGDSRGFYVEVKLGEEKWALFLERDR